MNSYKRTVQGVSGFSRSPFNYKGKKNNMKKYILMFLLMLSTSAFAEFHGGVSYDSDYFFRGVSQTNGKSSASAWLDWNSDQGIYVSAWAGQVDFGDTASLESNFYIGKESILTDNLSVDVGLLEYRYDHGYENLLEAYVGLNYGNVSLYHYVDTDTHNDYSLVSYGLWFVPVVDASISYGMFDKNNNHVQLDIDYNINDDFILGIDITEKIINGDYLVKNSIAVGLSYNF